MSASLAAGILSALTVLTGPQAPQSLATPPAAVGVLSVSGRVPKPLKLDAKGLARLPRESVRVKDHDGKDAGYEGVPLVELLKAAGLNLTPDELRGKALEYYLVVEASDGYRVVFSLPELAPTFTDRVVILADRRDGQPLSDKEGPFRVVIPGEKRQARWVRQVNGLKVGKDPG